MSFVLVFNPVSGLGRGRVLAEQLSAALRELGESVKLLETEADRSAFAYSCRDLDPEARYVVIGGDGTLHHFINAAPHCRHLAFLGMGTANVISIEWNLPRDVPGFVELLRSGRELMFYPGVVEGGTLFLMMYSFGHDAFVLSKVSQRLKNRIGKAAFLLSVLKALVLYPQPPLLLTCENGEAFFAYEAVVSRFRHYGGAFSLAPLAEPQDRRLWILALQRPGLWSALRYFARIFRGNCKDDSLTRFFPCTSLRLEVVDELPPSQLDGDLLSQPVRSISVSDRPLFFLVPPSKAESS